MKRRSPSDFTVGCKVKVFWRHDDAWYAGVIEDQQGEGDVVLSKIQYEDGDVEVLDLVGGRERVRLMERADGTPASDADEPDVFDEEDDEEEDERRRNRDRDRRRRRSTAGLSRRAAAKESSPPERAAGSTPVESERRRNPARLAALANAREGNLLNLAAHEEFPPGDERVAAVLEAMRGNDAARTLAELPEDPEPSGEVFRLGYRMGARRAIACCAALVAAAAARAPSLAPTGRTRTPTARAAEFKAAEAHRAAANHQRNKKVQETSAKGGGETAGETETATAATDSAPPSTGGPERASTGPPERASTGAPERASDASPKPAEESESARAAREAEAASMARGAELRAAAAADGGAWDDPLAFASRDPALRAAMEKLEAILAEEVFDPAGWEEGGWYDTDDDETGVAGALPNASDAARRAIDPALVVGVLGVDAAAEKRRAARGLSGSASRRPKSRRDDADADAVVDVGAVKSVKSETNVARVSDVSAVMTPEQLVAAAFAEAAEKRVAAEAALAAILDPVKLAQVREDALKAKPTTTAGRLIKAANNADARAEKIKAGGGGDGRALRVQGIRKAGPGRPPGSGSRGRGGGGGGGGASRAPAKPSEATLMEKSGPGAEAYEFRPPLAPTPEAIAARAYELAAADSADDEDEEADASRGKKEAASADPEAEPEPASAGKSSKKKGSSAKTATGFDGPAAASGGGDGEKRRKRPRTGAQGWGDGGRSVGGDATVTQWLTARGWGEYAAAFAERAIDFGHLGLLTLQDLEDLSVDVATRRKMLAAAAEYVSSRMEEDDWPEAEPEPASAGKSSKKKGSSAETATGFDGPAAANDGGDGKASASGGGDGEKRRKRPRTGAQGWGDGGRSVGGDATVTQWLTARGWGEYAAAFAERAIDFCHLGLLNLQDLEDLSVDVATRQKMLAAVAEYFSSRMEEDDW